MNCELCSEANTGPEHEVSEKHVRNQILFEYSKNKKQLVGNRKGGVVACNVTSNFTSKQGCVDPKIKISVKPNEPLKFKFTIKNDTNKEIIDIIAVRLIHRKLYFTMESVVGLPTSLKPKQLFQKEITVNFISSVIGQYEVPIVFYLRKKAVKENIIIVRDLVVFVEESQKVHEHIESPFTNKEVVADVLKYCNMNVQTSDQFRIPKNYKSIYASGLRVKEDMTQEFKDIVEDIRHKFTTGVTRENYIPFFHNLLWYEETIVRINLKKYNMSNVKLAYHGSFYSLFVPGLGEKRPSLLPKDILFVKPHNRDEVMFEGVITNIDDNFAHIRGFDPAFAQYYSSTATFDVRFFLSRMPLERMHRAVDSVFTEKQHTRIFPEENLKVPQVTPITSFYNQLVQSNPEQRCAVEHIVAGTCGTAPYLVHGPPGTGKTVTIVEAVLQLVKKNLDNRILVCTDSNMAADHVATMLIRYLHMFSGQEKMLLRANSYFRVWETLPECLLNYSNGTCRDSFHPVNISEFRKYNIVITTLSHAAKFVRELKSKKYKGHITHLFIDEAAQASEPSCLIPVCGLLKPSGILVLSGDPLQLGPVVISQNVKKLGLGVSLMERLKNSYQLYSDERNDTNYLVMLRNNFRSDRDILEIPNHMFYRGQLLALAAEDHLSRVDILGEQQDNRAIVFHGVLSKEQRMGKSPSYFNAVELEIVQKYIKALINTHNVRQEDIGVVTPYIRQVYQIKQWVNGSHYNKIEVGTVEAFQGKEKRVIIISTVRANCNLLDHDAKFQLGFLVDDKRFNVALTRAKAKTIIIGNPLCLQKDIKWRTYIQKCQELGTYRGFDASQVVDNDSQNEIKNMLNDIKISENSH